MKTISVRTLGLAMVALAATTQAMAQGFPGHGPQGDRDYRPSRGGYRGYDRHDRADRGHDSGVLPFILGAVVGAVVEHQVGGSRHDDHYDRDHGSSYDRTEARIRRLIETVSCDQREIDRVQDDRDLSRRERNRTIDRLEDEIDASRRELRNLMGERRYRDYRRTEDDRRADDRRPDDRRPDDRDRN